MKYRSRRHFANPEDNYSDQLANAKRGSANQDS